MKPHPHLVEQALELLDQRADRCAFVGDSVSDIQAANATRVRSIGDAKTPKRGDELAAAGADALASNIADLAVAVQDNAARATR